MSNENLYIGQQINQWRVISIYSEDESLFGYVVCEHTCGRKQHLIIGRIKSSKSFCRSCAREKLAAKRKERNAAYAASHDFRSFKSGAQWRGWTLISNEPIWIIVGESVGCLCLCSCSSKAIVPAQQIKSGKPPICCNCKEEVLATGSEVLGIEVNANDLAEEERLWQELNGNF
jgi:hypothetical protein